MATAILSQGLGKAYRIGREYHPEDTLRDAIARRVARARDGGRRRRSAANADPAETLWALRDVSLRVDTGEVLGIVGSNGSGKSTLLKVLSNICRPTTGQVGINGRVGSLLEVGTGFHPELTGRENVYLYGSILGMRRTEVQARFEEIVSFADVGRLLDTPVKRYSSGMQVRLAFAVAAHLEPDILLVDEVLAVGDAAFQRKCLGRMGEAARDGRTVLFVSHNMAIMKALCRRGVVLDHGELTYDGTIDGAISSYLGDLDRAMSIDVAERTDRIGWEVVRLVAIRVRGGGDGSEIIASGAPISFEFELDDPFESTACAFTIMDELGHPVAEFRSENAARQDTVVEPAPTRFACRIDALPLVPGRYRVDVALWAQGHLQDLLQSAAAFDVEPGVLDGRAVAAGDGHGRVAIAHRWTRG